MSKQKVTVKYEMYIFASWNSVGFGPIRAAWHKISHPHETVIGVEQEYETFKKRNKRFRWYSNITKAEIRETKKVTTVETIVTYDCD